jgi:hypothetical protein
MVKFTAAGPPKVVADTIEEFARGQGSLSAIVVPWESDSTTLRMAVTSVTADGWAIEHTNLGTIQLSGLGEDRTQVSFAAGDPDHPEKQKLAVLFDRFAHQLQTQFDAAS